MPSHDTRVPFDRRSGVDRRMIQIPVEDERRSGIERRSGVERRRRRPVRVGSITFG